MHLLLPAENDSDNASNAASSIEVKQTSQFSDSQRDQVKSATNVTDTTYMAGATPMYSPGNYLSRPIKLFSEKWAVNGSYIKNVDVYNDLCFSNVEYRKRLQTYAYFRGKVKARIVINGSPFWYGRIIAAFVPFTNSNAALTDASQNQSRLNTYLSQLPHVFVDPNSSNSVELEVQPYMVRNWLRLNIANTDGGAGDFDNLPHLFISSINNLSNANAASTGSVEISVFAWFEDPEVSVPTQVFLGAPPSNLVNQGAKKLKSMVPKEDTEEKASMNSKPVISSVASTISTGLGAMSSLPVIGPFMKAGAVASGAVSSIAKMFGFSRPMQLADTHRFFPEAINNLSSTSGVFTGYKMSVDPHQGVTVDPRVAMLDGTDELSIQHIASKSSYIHSFPVNENTTAIGSFMVTPLLSNIVDSVEQFSSCAFAAFPFTYWRGTVRIKFQVVASSFHRGRVGIYYDPVADSAAIFGDAAIHTHMNLVVDLEELDEMELDIPWLSAFPYLKCTKDVGDPAYQTPVRIINGTSRIRASNDENNGVIKMFMINELVSNTEPVTPIQINMFVSCPDLQVAFPGTIARAAYFPSTTSSLALKSPSAMKAKQNERKPFATPRGVYYNDTSDTPPTDVTSVDPLPSIPEDDLVNEGFGSDPDQGLETTIGDVTVDSDFPKVFFGEDIKSFRTLLKRFSSVFKAQSTFDTPDRGSILQYLPLMQTNYNGVIPGGSADVLVSNQIHLMEYLRFAYFGQRGGVRTFYSYDNDRDSASYHNATTVPVDISVFANPTMMSVNTFSGTATAGSVVNPGLQNDSLTFETPFYTANRFLISCDNDYGFGTFGFDQYYPSLQITSTVKGRSTQQNNAAAMVDMAAADDFSFVGYMAAPSHPVVLAPPS